MGATEEFLPITGIDVLAPPGSAAGAGRQVRVAAVIAALFGAFLVWGVGFAPLAAVHNAAHDVRHSMAYPCH